jgi:hypothetical protein
MKSVVERVEGIATATTSAVFGVGIKGITLINSSRNSFIKELERGSVRGANFDKTAEELSDKSVSELPNKTTQNQLNVPAPDLLDVPAQESSEITAQELSEITAQELSEITAQESSDFLAHGLKEGSNQESKSEESSIHRIIDSARNDSERGDVPGWVLVVLMTTGLVTAIWTIAAPRLSAILKNSLDAMNGIR